MLVLAELYPLAESRARCGARKGTEDAVDFECGRRCWSFSDCRVGRVLISLTAPQGPG